MAAAFAGSLHEAALERTSIDLGISFTSQMIEVSGVKFFITFPGVGYRFLLPVP